MKVALLKITALFSYCGGPLFVGELLKPRLNAVVVFLITFFPVGLMVAGALCLEDDLRSRWSRAAVSAGGKGLYLVLAMHLYALGSFLNGARVPEQGLYYLGIAVGVIWSVLYLRAARRWTPEAGRTTIAEDRTPPRRIKRS